MISQTQSGKAFDYALISTLYEKISKIHQVHILNDNSFIIAKKSFESFEHKKCQEYCQSADAAIDHILELEPRLSDKSSNDEIIISLRSSAPDKAGDPRDIIIGNSEKDWQIGFSSKNENSAVRHPRLSHLIDFGQVWLGINCSTYYMAEIKKNLFES